MALTDAQKQILNELQSKMNEGGLNLQVAPQQVPTERLRTIAQGASFGFSDEIEALARSAIPGGPEYETIRDDLRQRLKAYQQANPGEALSLELAGALVPTIAAAATGVGAPAAGARTVGMLRQLPTLAKIGAVEGAIAGAGYSEGESIGDVAIDTGLGAVTGAALNTGLGALTNKLALTPGSIINYTREKLGEKASSAVQAELRRLAEQTGKPTDVILQELAQGKLMAENKTLSVALRNYVQEGGEAGAAVTKRMGEAAQERKSQVNRYIQRLAGFNESNIPMVFTQKLDDIQKTESDMYKEIFKEVPEVPKSAALQIENIAQRYPDVIQNANKFYARKNIVPLFAKNNAGAVELKRIPSLEDMDIIYRDLRDTASKLYRDSKGQLAEVYASEANAIKNAMDEISPELGETRAQWANLMRQREAFQEGRKAWGKNPDDVEIDLQQMDEAARQAYQAGFASAVKNRMRAAKNPVDTLNKLANPETNQGLTLGLLTDFDRPTGLLSQAADTMGMAGFLDPMAGSQTALLQQDARRQMQAVRGTAMDVAGAASGDVNSIVNLAGSIVDNFSPKGLTPGQRSQVVDLLFTDDPDLLRRALTDEAALDEVVKKTDYLLRTFARGGQTGAIQQGTQMIVND